MSNKTANASDTIVVDFSRMIALAYKAKQFQKVAYLWTEAGKFDLSVQLSLHQSSVHYDKRRPENCVSISEMIAESVPHLDRPTPTDKRFLSGTYFAKATAIEHCDECDTGIVNRLNFEYCPSCTEWSDIHQAYVAQDVLSNSHQKL